MQITYDGITVREWGVEPGKAFDITTGMPWSWTRDSAYSRRQAKAVFAARIKDQRQEWTEYARREAEREASR